MGFSGGYPGGKGGAGVYQTLINLIPPHDLYIETHLGAGAVMKNKRPARVSIGLDIDAGVCHRWQCYAAGRADLEIINVDAAAFLSYYPFAGFEFIYCDPPYLVETRKTAGRLYAHEYNRQQHIKLLQTIKSLPCKVMISGYWSKLYDDYLRGWSVRSFEAMTRAGTPATEYVWFNYPAPMRLHDYSYLGRNFRERERIKRKTTRWVDRLKKMPVLEQRALLHAIDDTFK